MGSRLSPLSLCCALLFCHSCGRDLAAGSVSLTLTPVDRAEGSCLSYSHFLSVPMPRDEIHCCPSVSASCRMFFLLLNGRRLQASFSCRYPVSVTSLPCHPVYISRLFQAGGWERELCRYSPQLTITPAHTPDCSSRISS